MLSGAAPCELVYLQNGVVLRTLLQGELYIYISRKITIQNLWLLVKYDGIVKWTKKKRKKEWECGCLKAPFLANGLQSLRKGEHKSFLPQGPYKPGLEGKAGQSPGIMWALLSTRANSPGERISIPQWASQDAGRLASSVRPLGWATLCKKLGWNEVNLSFSTCSSSTWEFT